ncbi:MAG: hypothetical protein Fur009_3450 [Candidatus Microgenomates bacterium]
MIYSDLYFKQRQKISVYLIVLTFVFSIFIFTSIFSKIDLKQSRASKANLKRIEITNLNPIQATIFWQTDEKETGWVMYGEDKNNINTIVFDERDILENKGKYLNHYVVLKNLTPDKNYYYVIISDDKKIVRPDGQYFSFKTPKTISNLTKLSPISGKILNDNLLPLNSGVVLLSIKDKNLFSLSYLLKNSGDWIIPLNSFYSKDDYSEKVLTGDERAIVEIINEEGKKTILTGSLNKINSKTQTLIIGKNYNLTEESNVLAVTDKIDQKNVINIIYPQEGAIIPGRRPLIKGLALPEKEVFLTINSKTKTYNVNTKANKNGEWNYLSVNDFDLGDYKILLLTKNEKNQDIKIIRNFKLTGNDAIQGRVLGEATNEAKIITPTSIPTPTTISQSPTYIPTSMPKSGNFDFITIASSLAFIITGLGILLVF